MKGEQRKKDVCSFAVIVSTILAIFVLGQVLTGCGTMRPIAPSVKDSSRVEIRERLVRDTVFVPIEKEKEVIVTRDTISHLENTYAKSDAIVRKGELYHSLESKPQIVKVPVQVTVRDTIVVYKQAEMIIKEVERPLSAWQGFSMVLGWILGGLALMLAIVALVRRRLR